MISDEAELRDAIGSPKVIALDKPTDRLNDLTRQFIERSPFVCVATAHADGGLDVSPRGDPAGSTGAHESSTTRRCCGRARSRERSRS